MRTLVTLFAVLLTWTSFGAEVVPGEYIIRFKSRDNARAFFKEPANRQLGKYRWIRVAAGPFALIRTEGREQARNAVRTIQASGHVHYVEPNYIYRIQGFTSRSDQALNARLRSVPEDERFKELWGLHNTGQNGGTEGFDVNVVPVWKRGLKGNEALRIAVIDTGVDYKHPDLAANMWRNTKEIPGNGKDDDGNGFVDDVFGYDFANNDGDPMDDNRHGTHCAGTIGAVHDKAGVAGVMGKVQMIAVKFLTAGGSGTTEGAIKAIDYATRVGAHVMSNSWGGGGPSTAMQEVIRVAGSRGIVFVAAAGNYRSNNDTRPFYPASYQEPNVISVAAMDNKGNPASFTNYGQKSVHVAAPGVNILSTIPNGGFQFLSGTSMATPHVSGVVGLVMSREGMRASSSMRERLILTSRKHEALDKTSVSRGLVDTYAGVTGKRSRGR